MEHPRFEDVFPLENGGFSNVMLVFRGVYMWDFQEVVFIVMSLTFLPFLKVVFEVWESCQNPIPST